MHAWYFSQTFVRRWRDHYGSILSCPELAFSLSCRRNASAANIDDPCGRVELGEQLTQLPPAGADSIAIRSGLDCMQDGDTLGFVDLRSHRGNPSDGDDTVTCHCVEVEDGEADGWLSTLASDVGLRRGEGDRSQRDAGDEVDRVGVIGE